MQIVLFTHPAFLASHSMPRFAHMLRDAFQARGHTVQLWTPQPRLYRHVPEGRLKKWAGYVDQYILFPQWVRAQLKRQSTPTLYVFCDQALGPWVPLVSHLPHVVHAHDLLALRSALGDIPEHRTGWTGRRYQRYIRRGFAQARHFISISHKTREDLHHFGHIRPETSEVVYNGLNHPFAPMPQDQALAVLKQAGLPVESGGMLLHVSGGQWYKNLPGVIRLYAHYARTSGTPLPLWCVSPQSSAGVQAALAEVPPNGRVVFLQNLGNEALVAAYSLARVFLMPSLAEGFGWPLIEAQACGCPVLTTDAPPMNEIGGPAALYLPRLRAQDDTQAWAATAASTLQVLLALPPQQRQHLVDQCLRHAQSFQADGAINAYLQIYERILARRP